MRAAKSLFPYSTPKVPPPENRILLVQSPLGFDLAMWIDGHWYYKNGDDWNDENLEHWSYNQPDNWSVPPELNEEFYQEDIESQSSDYENIRELYNLIRFLENPAEKGDQ